MNAYQAISNIGCSSSSPFGFVVVTARSKTLQTLEHSSAAAAAAASALVHICVTQESLETRERGRGERRDIEERERELVPVRRLPPSQSRHCTAVVVDGTFSRLRFGFLYERTSATDLTSSQALLPVAAVRQFRMSRRRRYCKMLLYSSPKKSNFTPKRIE